MGYRSSHHWKCVFSTTWTFSWRGGYLSIGFALNLDASSPSCEGYLWIVRVNIVTSVKRAGFKHRAQRFTFSSSTAELFLWLRLYYPGFFLTVPHTILELVSFHDQQELTIFPRAALYPFIEYSNVPFFKQYMVQKLLKNTVLLLKQMPKICQIWLKLTNVGPKLKFWAL